MSSETVADITSQMRTCSMNIDFGELPDNLKCVHCKSVLQDACQLPCGCRLCRRCIADLRANGAAFCPGVTEDCGESLLSESVPDFSANKQISKLTVKCPNDGCRHECALATLEQHLRVCSSRTGECPFRELGCSHDTLDTEETSGHFRRQSHSHNEILIGMIGNITNEVTTLRRSDKGNKMMLEMLKRDLRLKEDQMKMLREENKLAKKEKEDLADCVRSLSERVERQIGRSSESEEPESEEMIKEFKSKGNIRSISQDTESTKTDIYPVEPRAQSIPRADASCEWLIDENIRRTTWRRGDRTSATFQGTLHPYRYQLVSGNGGLIGGSLSIHLLIDSGERDQQLPWLFRGAVTVTVTDKNKPTLCRISTQKCNIVGTPDNRYGWSDPFTFEHSALVAAGLNLRPGVRVACSIVTAADRSHQ